MTEIVPKHLAGLLLVVTVYLCSVLAASDYSFLSKRFTGLLQLTYSLVIAYAMFLTLVHGDRRQISRILLDLLHRHHRRLPARATMPACAA